jgi:uncharacterized protein YjbI with pentapeptide repeats
MFKIIPCVAGCGSAAITGSNLCFKHQANPELECRRIVEYIMNNTRIENLCVEGMNFNDVDFSERRFYGCNFRNTTFLNCKLTGIDLMMSFFDFSNFSNCDLSKSDIQFSSFAGAVFHDCKFEDCELVHLNFEGITAGKTSFSNSNLYNSRFINSELADSKFINCNLKRVFFADARIGDCNFKSSNTAEAVYEGEM